MAKDQLALAEASRGALAVSSETRDDGDLYKPVLRALRGRYLTAAVLGVAGAIVGAATGYLASKPLYRSEGLVQIAYDQPPVMGTAGVVDRTPPEIFEAFLSSQAAAMMGQDMLTAAVQEPTWKDRGFDTSSKTLKGLADGLKVEQKAGTDFMRITFTGKDPEMAGAAVRSVIGAYAKSYNSQIAMSHQQRLGLLEEHKNDLIKQRAALQQQADTIAQEMAQTDTDKLHEIAAGEVTKYRTMLEDIRLAKVLAEGANPPAAKGDSHDLVLDPQPAQAQISPADPVMHEFITEKNRIEDEIAGMRSRGYMDSHPAMVRSLKELDLANQRIATYQASYKPSAFGGGIATATVAPPADPVMALSLKSPAELQAAQTKVETLLANAETDMLKLGAKRQSLEQLKTRIDNIDKDITDVTQRYVSAKMESGVGGKLTILASGEVPFAPLQDRRPLFAAAGGTFGAILPAAVIAMLGMTRTRYRYMDEVESEIGSTMPVLGVLPLLPAQLDDSEMSTYAAHCVHQIRAMLQNQLSPGERPIFLISSASPGEGKTSLTAALGLSFAASGCRTLVMDCDMVGRQLTRGYSGEALTGLHEALHAGSLEGYVRETASAGLWVLPVGQGTAMDAGTLSSPAMQRLLKHARDHFDVVLVDSGPILGSVEASVIAPLADGVVLVVSRQQLQPLVQRAVRRLTSLGARTVGMIFNRAERRDFQSISRSFASSGSTSGLNGNGRRWQSDDAQTLGPVVSLVNPPPSNGRSRTH